MDYVLQEEAMNAMIYSFQDIVSFIKTVKKNEIVQIVIPYLHNMDDDYLKELNEYNSKVEVLSDFPRDREICNISDVLSYIEKEYKNMTVTREKFEFKVYWRIIQREKYYGNH